MNRQAAANLALQGYPATQSTSRRKDGGTVKKLIAIAALIPLLALAGCAQGAALPSAEAPSTNAASAATSNQQTSSPGEPAEQPQAPSASSPVASAESTLSPEPGAANAESAGSFVIGVGDKQLVAVLADTDAARTLAERLQDGPVTVSLHAYGGFEKVGSLPWALPQSDKQIAAEPGDVMLYQGDQITIFTGKNSWAYTPLGHIEGATPESLIEAFGDGDAEATLSLG